ncbi:conserved hypothetical protein [Frigoribacterium sp. 9N]|nr:conserved hypothetical protein [Frigoribacterium sp. 9N]
MSPVGVTVARMAPVLTSPVVSTQWLADHLGADDLTIVDATVLVDLDLDVDLDVDPGRGVGPGRGDGPAALTTGRDGFERDGHVPGAVLADLLVDFSDPGSDLPFTRPGVDRFQAAAAALGVSNDSTVVVYDTVDGRWASRLWWLFRAYGHDAVAVLDGGWSQWLAQGKPYDLGDVLPTPAPFVATERPDHWVDKAFVESVVAGDERAALVSGSPRDEFDGTSSPFTRAGHIPGSVNVPAETLLADDGTLARDPVLRDRLAVVPDEPRTVVYCASGVSASVDALAFAVLGRSDVAVYDGSLAEWVADPAAPLVPAAA